jgi:hypothetical protein
MAESDSGSARVGTEERREIRAALLLEERADTDDDSDVFGQWFVDDIIINLNLVVHG